MLHCYLLSFFESVVKAVVRVISDRTPGFVDWFFKSDLTLGGGGEEGRGEGVGE